MAPRVPGDLREQQAAFGDGPHLLLEKTIRIEATYNLAYGLQPPKDGDVRVIYLTSDAINELEAWTKHVGVQTDGLVFPAPRSSEYVNDDYLRKIVNKARVKAGIPLEDERTRRPRKPLHSLRSTWIRRQLEQGRNPLRVKEQAGHTDLSLTTDVYGRFTTDALAAEAARPLVDQRAALPRYHSGSAAGILVVASRQRRLGNRPRLFRPSDSKASSA
jgi:integrase